MVEASKYVNNMPIWVVDNFLKPYEHEAVSAYCKSSLYTLDHTSNSNSEYPVSRMAAILTQDQIAGHVLTSSFIKFAERLSMPVNISRAYINASDSDSTTVEHFDQSEPGLTMCYYPNAFWKLAWGGETLFFDDNKELAFGSILKPNRAIFFDPRILHTARPPTKMCNVYRYTFVYKSTLA